MTANPTLMMQREAPEPARLLTGTLVWEFGQNTMSISSELAERLGFPPEQHDRIAITSFRDLIAKEDLSIVYERLSRSFLRSEPLISVYGVRLADGSARRVRSVSRWDMNHAGKPTLFVASIDEIQSRMHTLIEDEFIERMIDLRFLAERAQDGLYRQIVDTMLQQIWKHRRPD